MRRQRNEWPAIVFQLRTALLRQPRPDLEILSNDGEAGHNYIDISTPAPTLVVSRDEYVDVVYPWIDPPSSGG